jgi:pyruvate-formate lyase-activating enzyme
VALAHIDRVKKSVVSFGQGCEGDPLMAAEVIAPAIRLIRLRTRSGTINMNTNGSRPKILERLFEVGLDSVRISMNSVREQCYHAYFRPRGYRFADVLKSIEAALERKKFVAVNYLNCPGFTDTPQEVEALTRFLNTHPIHMIQWRNLNYDPIRYLKKMNAVVTHGKPLGMDNLINRIRTQFPKLKFGYFNPPKERFN